MKTLLYIFGIIIAICLSCYIFIWIRYKIALDESNKDDYISFFVQDKKGKITSIHYFKDVFPNRPVISFNEYGSSQFSQSFYCSDDIKFNELIEIGDSVYKSSNSNIFTFYKMDGRKYEKKLEFCPDFPNFAKIDKKYK